MTKSDDKGVSRVIAGKEKPKRVAKTMLVDENGVDLEAMQDMIRRQAKMIEDLSIVVKARDSEDAEITRKLIVSKSHKWDKAFTYDELIEYEKDELDDLHKFVCRVGKVNLSEIDELPTSTLVKAARRFPKLSQDKMERYETGVHKFSII